MEELSLEQLKEKLVELGMPQEDADNFRTKAAAQSTIEVLKAAEAKKTVDEEERVKTLEERPDPKEEKQVNRNWKSKAENMKAKLLKMEFVSLLVPLDPNEQVGEVTWIDPETEEELSFEEWFALPFDAKMRSYQKHKGGAYIAPQLNGYKYMIPKGVYTRVPLQIFQVVNESNMERIKATQYKNLDRIDPRTGQPVRESF